MHAGGATPSMPLISSTLFTLRWMTAPSPCNASMFATAAASLPDRSPDGRPCRNSLTEWRWALSVPLPPPPREAPIQTTLHNGWDSAKG
eukprot:6336585-Alexandrium_andersonii.AAC.1